MKKLCASFIFCLCVLCSLWAAGGLMTGQGQVRSVSTKYFDILFTQNTEQSAFLLLQQADKIYEEIRRLFGAQDYPDFRMPVVITSSTDEYNAYFTDYNYNHIVLYDVIPSDTYAVFEDSLLDTFRHELTHAILINLRNGFWHGFDMVFGDLYNWGNFVVMPMLIKEGASVYAESSGGYGRLNDGFYLHTARQAKVQGSFPRAGDVTGARDSYPWGSLSYAFGGPFTQWLIETYGMEKYTAFWDKAVNMKSLVFAQAFKSAYGIRLTDAWNQFYQLLAVPEVEKDPLQNNAVTVFESAGRNGLAYTSLCVSDTGIAYLDKADGSVWFSKRNEDNSFSDAQKLFSKAGAKKITLSKDGQYIAVCYTVSSGARSLSYAGVYSVAKDSWTQLPAESVTDIGFARMNSKTVLCCLNAEGPEQSLSVFSLTVAALGKVKLESVLQKQIERGTLLYSPCDCGDNSVAFWKRKNGQWSFVVFSLTGETFCEAQLFDSSVSVRDLALVAENADGVTLSFSWCAKNTFPRMATVSITEGSVTYSVMNSDLSGGVLSPVSTGNGQFVYAADFVTHTLLYTLNADLCTFDTVRKNLISADFFCADKTSVVVESDVWLHPYYSRGTLIPFCNMESYGRMGSVSSRILFPGLTWMTNTPWDSDLFSVSFGVSPGNGFLSPLQSNDFEAAAQIRFASSESPSSLNYDARAQVFFNLEGFTQASAALTLKTYIPFADTMSLFFQNESLFVVTKERLSVDNTFMSQLGSIHQMGRGRYAQGGFALQLVSTIYYEHSLTDALALPLQTSVYPALIVRLPYLIPVSCAYDFTYNLPFRAQLMLYPTESMPMDLQLDTVLFSWDIQKGFIAFPLYLNCVTVSCGYECLFELIRGRQVFWDVANTDVLLDFAINTGAAANQAAVLKAGVSLKYYPRKTSGNPFAVSFVTSFIF